jgi:hypothetical protein
VQTLTSIKLVEGHSVTGLGEIKAKGKQILLLEIESDGENRLITNNFNPR